MNRFLGRGLWIGAALLTLAGGNLAAQEAEPAQAAASNQIDIIHHIGNSHEIDLEPFTTIHLPRWTPVQIGGLAIDFSPTKHVVFMVLSALIVAIVFIVSSSSVARAQAKGQPPKGFGGVMEAMALYIRQEVILPNVGHHGEGYSPFLLTLFFFILVMNLFGLIPYGATATGNIAVTAALALITFIVIEVSGMVTLGAAGYLKTIFYIPPGLPGGVGGAALKVVLLVIMTPIEIIGKLAKPFALAVRLFANMTAGHVLVLALIGLTFIFRSYAVGVGASLLATGIMLLELFVAFLQAFVFTLLASVFIGLMRAEH
ncbi:MAG: F0F1 ATP synthase subunit A [Gemmatimonadota bacterium]